VTAAAETTMTSVAAPAAAKRRSSNWPKAGLRRPVKKGRLEQVIAKAKDWLG
jgi:hypothetical protein